MADKTWKARERRVCQLLGCTRRGADYADRDGGKNDCCEECGYSVEIRNRKNIPFSQVRDQVNKAEQRARPEQIPVAIMFNPGMHDKDGLVFMRLETFRQWFVSVKEEEKIAVPNAEEAIEAIDGN